MFRESEHFTTIATHAGANTRIDAIILRSILHNDVELQRSFFNSLTSQSRFMRFMSPMREIPDYVLRMLSCVNSENHLGYMLTVGSGQQTQMIGEARLILGEDDQFSGEFALALKDDHHGYGLAKKLLQLLETVAAQNGIHKLTGSTLRSNEAMKKLARRCQYSLRNDVRDSRAIIMEKSIAPLALSA